MCRVKKHTRAPCARAHSLHTQSSSQQVLHSPSSQRGNYHTRRSAPSPIIASVLHYPQNACACFSATITDDTFCLEAIYTAVPINIPAALRSGWISWLLVKHRSGSPDVTVLTLKSVKTVKLRYANSIVVELLCNV